MCIATITHPGGKGRPCVIEYRVDGQRFSAFGPRLRYLAAGEHFQLIYNKQKPWKHKLLTDKRIFLNNEQTAFVQGKVLHCVNSSFTRISFVYTVQGKQYKKQQLISGPSGLKKRDKCLVQFSMIDPQRSILIGGSLSNNQTEFTQTFTAER
jgi:hypothetical protein